MCKQIYGCCPHCEIVFHLRDQPCMLGDMAICRTPAAAQRDLVAVLCKDHLDLFTFQNGKLREMDRGSILEKGKDLAKKLAAKFK